MQFQPLRRSISCSSRVKRSSVICSAALVILQAMMINDFMRALTLLHFDNEILYLRRKSHVTQQINYFQLRVSPSKSAKAFVDILVNKRLDLNFPFLISCSKNSPDRSVHVLISLLLLQNARCGAEQTQTVTRESSTITVAPTQGNNLIFQLLCVMCWLSCFTN